MTAKLAPWFRSANCTLIARRAQGEASAARTRQTVRPLTWLDGVERVTGIEPALSAWEADVLPLNYTRASWAGLEAPTLGLPGYRTGTSGCRGLTGMRGRSRVLSVRSSQPSSWSER